MASGTIEQSGWTLIWENPNHNARFNAQTVSLDLSKYSDIRIGYGKFFDAAYDSNAIAFTDVPVGYKAMLQFAFYQLTYRAATVSKTGIAFGEAWVANELNQAPTSGENYQVIPHYIFAR